MPFGRALELMKCRTRMTRTGWNAPGQWVVMLDRLETKVRVHSRAPTRVGELGTIGPGLTARDYHLEPFLVLKNASDKLVPWVPSMGDVLAEDWEEATP
jgi:hypothetical protein